jgi:hypothetical protein
MHRHKRARDIAVPIAGLFFISLCLVFAAVTASAQETTGSLRGTVTDINGAVVPEPL